MTTVAAIARDGHVWMAADSRNNVYDRPIIGGARKIRRILAGDVLNDQSPEILLGVSGIGALANLVPKFLKVTAAPGKDEDPQPWAHAIASAVTEIALEAGCIEDGVMGGTFILGALGRVWTVTHHQAIPHPDGIAAVGSGEAVAIGAMDAALALDVDPIDAVRDAVSIACFRDQFSAGPVVSEKL